MNARTGTTTTSAPRRGRPPTRPEEGIVKFTVYFDRDTHRALRIASFEDSVTATHLIVRLVREYLAGRTKKKGGRR